MEVFLIGVGAAGNKAVLNAVETGVVELEDTMIVNSTSKDFPKEYKGKTVVLSEEDTGCGKERSISKEYTKKAISDGKFNIPNIGKYSTVIIVTSVEGGTGSGAAPLVAKFFNKVHVKNTHIIAFTGFEDDVRGLANTVDFFKEIAPEIIVQTISNASFMGAAANGNKLRAEELANNEMSTRIRVLTGQDFIEGDQNIDDTDILKLSNTSGYMTVEKKIFKRPLETRDDFERIVKNMIYNSASIKCNDPAPQRIGVILNISAESEDAVDYQFESVVNYYGKPYEKYTQVQWDGKQEYIAYIVSGMKMPLDEIKTIYDRYIEQTNKINKESDEFFTDIKDMNQLDIDKKFDMIKEVSKGMSIADFLDED